MTITNKQPQSPVIKRAIATASPDPRADILACILAADKALRRHRLKDAEKAIKQAHVVEVLDASLFRQLDPNYRPALDVLRGRLEFHKRRFGMAIVMYDRADTLWDAIRAQGGTVNERLVRYTDRSRKIATFVDRWQPGIMKPMSIEEIIGADLPDGWKRSVLKETLRSLRVSVLSAIRTRG